MNAKSQMIALIEQLKNDKGAEMISARRKDKVANLGLVNHYRIHDLIPNKWFDWVNRAESSIMVLGQDWGPYSALKKYLDLYEIESHKKDFDYSKFLFSSFSSRTEKFILKAIEQTYSDHFGRMDMKIWDDIIFSMAVLFTRQGIHFRGNHNFDPKQSAIHSYPFVSEQINIVKPKIIITLGGMAFDVVNSHYELGFNKTITQIVQDIGDGVIESNDGIVIPNFHPASYTDPNLQMRIWSKIWKYY